MTGNPERAGTPDGRSSKRPGLEEQRRSIFEAAVELFRRDSSRAV